MEGLVGTHTVKGQVGTNTVKSGNNAGAIFQYKIAILCSKIISQINSRVLKSILTDKKAKTLMFIHLFVSKISPIFGYANGNIYTGTVTGVKRNRYEERGIEQPIFNYYIVEGIQGPVMSDLLIVQFMFVLNLTIISHSTPSDIPSITFKWSYNKVRYSFIINNALTTSVEYVNLGDLFDQLTNNTGLTTLCHIDPAFDDKVFTSTINVNGKRDTNLHYYLNQIRADCPLMNEGQLVYKYLTLDTMNTKT
jgi:hypothetical protein